MKKSLLRTYCMESYKISGYQCAMIFQCFHTCRFVSSAAGQRIKEEAHPAEGQIQ